MPVFHIYKERNSYLTIIHRKQLTVQLWVIPQYGQDSLTTSYPQAVSETSHALVDHMPVATTQ